MATVGQILDRVCSITGYDTTASSTERNYALSVLNDGYKEAVERSECYASSATKTLTAGTATYTIGTAPLDVTDILKLVEVTAPSSGRNRRMQLISPQQMRQMEESESSGTGNLFYYAFPAPNKIVFYPTPSSGQQVSFDYIATPLTLVESSAGAGEETTPSAFPSRFHFEVLASYATAHCLERDNRFEEAQLFFSKFENGMQKLTSWVNDFGGTVGASVRTDISGAGASFMPDTYP